MSTVAHLGKRGTLVIPAEVRRALNLDEGSLLLLEIEGSKLIVRAARAVPVEEYTNERKAQFLLNNAVDADDYALARNLVTKMGLDPDRIPHERPA